MDLVDFVIMPGVDYKNACDAVREKTGKTDGIKSSDLANEILGILPKLQMKTVLPSTEEQNIVPDEGYDGLSEVIVMAAPAEGNIVRNVTITTNRQAEVSYVSANGGELVSMEMAAGDEITVEVPVTSLIYITGVYRYRPGGSTSGTSGWSVIGNNVTVDTYDHQIQESTGAQFRYGAIAYITDISQDATITISTASN